MVSAYCLAYNHEKYIRYALEGFVKQKTNFRFEVIVHDDASTDKTADIIKECAQKYPDIIKPIFQTENQYSQSIPIINTYIFPKCRGKYIAICEGDDYWCDEFKLQKQVDYMESHPECTFCFSNGYIENQIDGSVRDFLPHKSDIVDNSEFVKCSREVDLGGILRLAFVPTASFMYRRETRETLPDEFNLPCPTGDLKLRLFLVGAGVGYYFSDKMTVYRENVPDSALSRWNREKKEGSVKVYERERKVLDMLENVNKFTDRKYEKEIMSYAEVHYRAILLNTRTLKVLKDKDCLMAYKRFSIKNKLKFWIKLMMPGKLKNFMVKMKNK